MYTNAYVLTKAFEESLVQTNETSGDCDCSRTAIEHDSYAMSGIADNRINRSDISAVFTLGINDVHYVPEKISMDIKSMFPTCC